MRTTLLPFGALCVSALCLAGCQHDETTVFPPGLDPLATDTVSPPAGGADDAVTSRSCEFECQCK